MNPKPIVAESYVTITWKGFSHSPKLFCPPLRVTLSSMSSVLIFNLFVQRIDSVSQRINHYAPDKYW